MNKEKRSRKRNWEGEEKILLTELVSQHNIIENKQTDTNTSSQKLLAWEAVCQEFQAVFPERSLGELKVQWKKLKSTAKKNISEIKRQRRKTGGGPPTPNVITDIDLKLLEELPYEFQKDESKWDSDATNLDKSDDITVHSQFDRNTIEEGDGLLNSTIRDQHRPSTSNEAIYCVPLQYEYKNAQEVTNLEDTHKAVYSKMGEVNNSKPAPSSPLKKPLNKKRSKMTIYETEVLKLQTKRNELEMKIIVEKAEFEMSELKEVYRLKKEILKKKLEWLNGLNCGGSDENIS